MKTSVIIPAYNSEKTIIETLDSIRKQTARPYEIIITNDGSTDNTVKIISEYADQYKEMPITVLSQPNGGIGNARNKSLFAATGDIVSFVDSDDYWHPTKIEKVQNIFEKIPDTDVVYHGELKIHDSGKKEKVSHPPMRGNTYKFLLLNGNQMATSATSVKRTKIVELGGFSEDPSINSVEDYDMWLRLAKNGANFYYLDEVLCEYRLSSTSITKKVHYWSTNCFNVWSSHLKYMFENEIISKNEYENHTFYQKFKKDFKITRNLIQNRELNKSSRYIFHSLKTYPVNPLRYLFLIRWYIFRKK